MAVFGMPFLCVGVFGTLLSAGVLPLHNAQSAPWFMVPAMRFMSIVFTLVGGGLVLSTLARAN